MSVSCTAKSRMHLCQVRAVYSLVTALPSHLMYRLLSCFVPSQLRSSASKARCISVHFALAFVATGLSEACYSCTSLLLSYLACMQVSGCGCFLSLTTNRFEVVVLSRSPAPSLLISYHSLHFTAGPLSIPFALHLRWFGFHTLHYNTHHTPSSTLNSPNHASLHHPLVTRPPLARLGVRTVLPLFISSTKLTHERFTLCSQCSRQLVPDTAPVVKRAPELAPRLVGSFKFDGMRKRDPQAPGKVEVSFSGRESRRRVEKE